MTASAGQIRQLFAVGEAVALGAQFVVLAGEQFGGVDLLDFAAQTLGAALERGFVFEQVLDLAAHVAQAADDRRQRLARVHQVGIAIEQVDVRGGLEQRQMRALPVYVHQQIADLAEHVEVDGHAVDARRRAPVGADFARERQQVAAVFVDQPFAFQHRRDQRLGGVVEGERRLRSRFCPRRRAPSRRRLCRRAAVRRHRR